MLVISMSIHGFALLALGLAPRCGIADGSHQGNQGHTRRVLQDHAGIFDRLRHGVKIPLLPFPLNHWLSVRGNYSRTSYSVATFGNQPQILHLCLELRHYTLQYHMTSQALRTLSSRVMS